MPIYDKYQISQVLAQIWIHHVDEKGWGSHLIKVLTISLFKKMVLVLKSSLGTWAMPNVLTCLPGMSLTDSSCSIILSMSISAICIFCTSVPESVLSIIFARVAFQLYSTKNYSIFITLQRDNNFSPRPFGKV